MALLRMSGVWGGYLEDRACAVHLEFLVLALQVRHQVLNHPLGPDGKSVTALLEPITGLY